MDYTGGTERLHRRHIGAMTQDKVPQEVDPIAQVSGSPMSPSPSMRNRYSWLYWKLSTGEDVGVGILEGDCAEWMKY